jgi:DNA-binding NarL/FixJ family response regulator
LFKDASKDQIVRTIREVYSGEEQLPLAVAQRLAERLQRQNLTPREIEVL